MSMSNHYILTKDRIAVKCDLMDWAKWYESNDRKVRQDTFRKHGGKEVCVSTVFLGLDHNWGGGPPLLFETMIFGGEHDQYQERCSTWDEAEEMHRVAVRLVEGSK